MCTEIKVLSVVDELETVGDFIGYLSKLVHDKQISMNDIVLDARYSSINMNDCLCCIDIPATLKKNNIGYYFNGVHYLIGEDCFTFS